MATDKPTTAPLTWGLTTRRLLAKFDTPKITPAKFESDWSGPMSETVDIVVTGKKKMVLQ